MPKKEVSKKEEETIKKDVVKEIKDKVLSEVNKEIKNSIMENTKKYKEDLRVELLEDVNSEVADLVKKEEKRILKGKNASIFKRDVIISLLFALILYFGYCLYDVKYFNFMKSECERNGNCSITENNSNLNGENKEQVSEIVKDKDWYIEHFGDLLEKTKLSLNADSVSAYYLYSTDRKVSEMKSSILLNLAYNSLSSKSIKTNSVNITVEGEELKNAFEALFGSLVNYKPTSFSYNCLNFKYSEDKDRYTAENNKCETSNNKILEEIEDMYEEGDVLYIITNATIYNESENSFYTFDNLYEPEVTGVTENDVKENARRLNRYQYQFKKNEDAYYLDSIIKLK